MRTICIVLLFIIGITSCFAQSASKDWEPQNAIESVFGPNNPYEKEFLALGRANLLKVDDFLLQFAGFPGVHNYQLLETITCKDNSVRKLYSNRYSLAHVLDALENPLEASEKLMLKFFKENGDPYGYAFIPNPYSMNPYAFRFLAHGKYLMEPVQQGEFNSGLHTVVPTLFDHLFNDTEDICTTTTFLNVAIESVFEQVHAEALKK